MLELGENCVTKPKLTIASGAKREELIPTQRVTCDE